MSQLYLVESIRMYSPFNRPMHRVTHDVYFGQTKTEAWSRVRRLQTKGAVYLRILTTVPRQVVWEYSNSSSPFYRPGVDPWSALPTIATPVACSSSEPTPSSPVIVDDVSSSSVIVGDESSPSVAVVAS